MAGSGKRSSSARRLGDTCPCGEMMGASATVAYSSAAMARTAGSAGKSAEFVVVAIAVISARFVVGVGRGQDDHTSRATWMRVYVVS
ncbi:hypothetical protein GCM10009776_20460 [Microbacterium deminutum]|uniref:Uncharacterized protein n=1 Tax=Microbacterium deminutum TaxID=344164 RepID=A0ABP5C826_9MICO